MNKVFFFYKFVPGEIYGIASDTDIVSRSFVSTLDKNVGRDKNHRSADLLNKDKKSTPSQEYSKMDRYKLVINLFFITPITNHLFINR